MNIYAKIHPKLNIYAKTERLGRGRSGQKKRGGLLTLPVASENLAGLAVPQVHTGPREVGHVAGHPVGGVSRFAPVHPQVDAVGAIGVNGNSIHLKFPFRFFLNTV